ncbi:MAG: hypothetical protein QNK23_14595 [Crocinitomicaceae bacterium]|nr:hypothetical protein [Crocinitomicaceae bacterium]
MSKSNSNHLFSLIKSLTKAEKRHFRLYATRNFGDKDVKFLTLFDALDKQDSYDSDKVRKRFTKTSASALSNIKAHLHEQLLISLRLLHHTDSSVRIHELLSFANVLYSKGLYMQSLEQLKRARTFAESIEDDLALHTIIEMERRLELLFVTESGENKAQEIVETNLTIRKQLDARDDWSNIALLLYDYYLKFGHVKNERQFKVVESFFKEKTKGMNTKVSSLQGKIYMHMAFTWYHFITQNFVRCYRHASDWVNLIESNELIQRREPVLYLKGIHNALSALFYSNKPRQFEALYKDFVEYCKVNESSFDQNTKILSGVYRYLGGLNQLFLSGNFRNNEDFISEIEQWLKENKSYLDLNRLQVFQYKLACLCFGADDFKNCIKYLNKIIHSDVKESYLKQDVQCFSRILNLVAHYELGNDDLLEYQLKSTYRFLIKYGDLQNVQEQIIAFIRKSATMQASEMNAHFIDLKDRLEEVFKDPYERRPLLYLDLISWLTSKIENVEVEHVIRKRQLSR